MSSPTHTDYSHYPPIPPPPIFPTPPDPGNCPRSVPSQPSKYHVHISGGSGIDQIEYSQKSERV